MHSPLHAIWIAIHATHIAQVVRCQLGNLLACSSATTLGNPLAGDAAIHLQGKLVRIPGQL